MTETHRGTPGIVRVALPPLVAVGLLSTALVVAPPAAAPADTFAGGAVPTGPADRSGGRKPDSLGEGAALAANGLQAAATGAHHMAVAYFPVAYCLGA